MTRLLLRRQQTEALTSRARLERCPKATTCRWRLPAPARERATPESGLLNSLRILEDPALTTKPIETVVEVYGAALRSPADST